MNLKNIRNIVRRGVILENEPMCRHTTFRVGGPARYLIRPATRKELAALVHYLYQNRLPYFVMGNGSDLLVSDAGYNGTIIDMGKHDGTEFTMLGIDDGTDDATECGPGEIRFDAGAGCLMSDVGRFAAQFGGSGFEGLAGIPGCVGGACAMNAGAYGSEMKDVIRKLTVVSPKGEILTLDASEVRFAYRTTSILEDGYLVARAELCFQKGDPEQIREKTEEFLQRRKEKQPLEYPSAGSTFKRPEGAYAGQLIEQAGLKGFSIGGAQVSEKHSGFLINKDNASAQDIYDLIRAVQKRVFEASGFRLEPEVRMLGEFRES